MIFLAGADRLGRVWYITFRRCAVASSASARRRGRGRAAPEPVPLLSGLLAVGLGRDSGSMQPIGRTFARCLTCAMRTRSCAGSTEVHRFPRCCRSDPEDDPDLSYSFACDVRDGSPASCWHVRRKGRVIRRPIENRSNVSAWAASVTFRRSRRPRAHARQSPCPLWSRLRAHRAPRRHVTRTTAALFRPRPALRSGRGMTVAFAVFTTKPIAFAEPLPRHG